MAFFRKIKAGLVKSEIANYIGEDGNIFFNTDTGELRLSNGVTPGGLPIYAQGTGGNSVSLKVVGSVLTQSDLDASYQGETGDTVVAQDTGNFWIWDGTIWVDLGAVQISQGYTGSQGNIGYTGSQGNIGYTGSQGATGFTGSQGGVGYSGSIGFTGSQGATGFTGSIGFTGSTGAGFTGSQGDAGFTGSQGEVGYTGSIGFTGSQGEVGYTGSQGDVGSIGYTGSQGDIGYSGSQGDTGYTGSQGEVGYTGSIGFTGSQGDIGYTGSQGDVGFTGSIGFTGSAGSGFTGSQGDTGYIGSQGYTGSAGIDGIVGRDGYTGSQGDVGYTGSAVPGMVSDGSGIITIEAGYSIVPATDGLQSLGSPTAAWAELYVSGNSIYLGDNVISINADGSLDLTDVNGNAIPIRAKNFYIGSAGMPAYTEGTDISGFVFSDGSLQTTSAPKMYTNADAANGLSLSDLKPGDYYYDDVNASIYICYDTGLGYFDILDLTVRAS